MKTADEKMVARLRERGWFVWGPTAKPSEKQMGSYAQLYATNELGETYRVAGWEDGIPCLEDGRGGTFPGMFTYVYTIGPK